MAARAANPKDSMELAKLVYEEFYNQVKTLYQSFNSKQQIEGRKVDETLKLILDKVTKLDDVAKSAFYNTLFTVEFTFLDKKIGIFGILKDLGSFQTLKFLISRKFKNVVRDSYMGYLNFENIKTGVLATAANLVILNEFEEKIAQHRIDALLMPIVEEVAI